MRTLLKKFWHARRGILIYAAILTLGWLAGLYLKDLAIPEMRPMNEPQIHRILMTALVLFVLTAAIPFVPGAEIGFALLFLFGGQAAFLVFVGMVGAMLLAYATARLVPTDWLIGAARWLRLKRLTTLLQNLRDTRPQDRIAELSSRTTRPLLKSALRNRYLCLIILMNTPGNSLIGGGGGISFFAGASGIYSFWPFLLSVIIAIAPVPLVFALMS